MYAAGLRHLTASAPGPPLGGEVADTMLDSIGGLMVVHALLFDEVCPGDRRK